MMPLASLMRSHAGEQAGREHHEGGDLRRPVDIVPTACDVGRGNHRDGSGEQDRRGSCDARGPQPSAQPTDGAEHREGPNAGEARGRARGVSGPLALQTHGRAAQRSNQEPNDVRVIHRGGSVRVPILQATRRTLEQGG